MVTRVFPADNNWEFSENHLSIISCSQAFPRISWMEYTPTKTPDVLRVLFDGSESRKFKEGHYEGNFIIRRNKDTYDKINVTYKFDNEIDGKLIYKVSVIDKIKYNDKEYIITDKIRKEILNILVE